MLEAPRFLLVVYTIFSNALCEVIFDANLSQLINNHIRINGNILDLVLTDSEEIIPNWSLMPIYRDFIMDIVLTDSEEII